MTRRARRVAVLAAILAVAGATITTLGLVPIAASAGHWAVTEWLLHFTMRRAVQMRAMAVEEGPPLDDPALVLRGAGHYAAGCAPCHGAPGAKPSVVSRHMTPEPPLLAARIPAWRAPELFWIVRNGVKFTAMPAWPAHERDDEVWAMVAFLRRLPELAPEDYRRLAFGSSGGSERDAAVRLKDLDEPLRRTLVTCERCHGQDGLGRGVGAFPRLAGLSEDYLTASLQTYARGTRHSGIMQPIAAGLEESMIQALARHFSRLAAAPVPTDQRATPALRGQGPRIASRGVPERKVAPCVPCHGPGTGARNPAYPALAGQYAVYLADQLRLFATGRRGGTPWAEVMRISTHRLRESEIQAVSAYYSQAAPAP
jgi:cytochrome c553